MTGRRKQARWRKARMPLGMNLMGCMLWEREHSRDIELWRGDKRLAVVRCDGHWYLDSCLGKVSNQAGCEDQAKREARHAVSVAEGEVI